jgi:hypothetical protein
MEEMKTDMSGGAAVKGAIMAAADMQIPLNVVALIPASDNMPSGSAFKPGDILKIVFRQDHRNSQYGRRGTAASGRCAGLCF